MSLMLVFFVIVILFPPYGRRPAADLFDDWSIAQDIV